MSTSSDVAAVQAVAAALSGFTQGSRLLRLHTPLGPDRLLAEALSGAEGIDSGFRFALSCLSTDAGIALKTLIGQPVLLELSAGPGLELRPFHGHVTAAELCGADGALARYRLTIEPWTAFLALGRDSRTFQDRSVLEVIDTVLRAWSGRGRLAPAWRIEADRALYPRRSLVTQYQESDLAFVRRLMSEEGLFGFFEHRGDADAGALGAHTLVIADSNHAFRPNPHAVARFTQPGAVMKEDSVDRWRSEARLGTNAVELRSWDYRSRSVRAVEAAGTAVDGAAGAGLRSADAPGAYAYATREHGRRIAERQLQALDAARAMHTGAGTLRGFAPGTTFSLSGHPSLDGASFLLVRVRHLAHNNLDADVDGALARRLGADPVAALGAGVLAAGPHASGRGIAGRPVYRNSFDAIPADLPYRSASEDGHGRLLHPRPTVHGQQTAIVVGAAGAPVHTDRDHRIKVQFHWQRGGAAHNRLAHPAPDGHTGAPADDGAGTWVRVAAPLAPVAGANWGSHALPRVGQEVLVDFIDGNIDRPVVIGAVYNGAGAQDAQHNEVAAGAGAATGNAGAWFPGESGGHAHPALLSGLKSQALAASAEGAGAYGQLVFDAGAGQARVSLQQHARAHEGSAELNLGHLRHQTDNRRLDGTGFGAELKTAHALAVRARLGLLASSDAQAGAGGEQMDARPARTQIDAARELATALARTAQQQNARLAGEAEADQLPALAALQAAGEAIEASAEAGAAAQAGAGATGAAAGDAPAGGMGSAAAFDAPQLQLSAPAGIVAVTPASAILAAGATGIIGAGQDIDLAAQGSLHHAVKAGIGLFTHGKAAGGARPVQDTGIRLHAASGKLSTQSQGGATRLTADKTVTVASVQGSVTAAARDHVLMTAQGAYLKLAGGDIMLHCPGKVEFKASVKELTGPQRAYGPQLAFDRPGALDLETVPAKMSARVIVDRPLQDLMAAGGGAVPYRFIDHTGQLIAKGTLDDNGATGRVYHQTQRDYTVLLGEPGDWTRVEHDDDVCGCGGGHEEEHGDTHGGDAAQDAVAAAHPADGADEDGAGADAGSGDDDAAEGGAGSDAGRAFERSLLDHLVFADADILKCIEEGEE
ncbi:type VI secretion system tip protein VgrG [Massilia forsythiae]|uniref:Type VI secretion system tip protein VgrG n=1 Tax=Massilia forsythiae TaxID=2728020 RepID=A0A7Z2VZ12_9BURK|nr:type VI secretion system Vgr family protein [Massilia forsythiae]QJE02033.1 type VI secretion system tip protein VgrG [Massilia forsythiae]